MIKILYLQAGCEPEIMRIPEHSNVGYVLSKHGFSNKKFKCDKWYYILKSYNVLYVQLENATYLNVRIK